MHFVVNAAVVGNISSYFVLSVVICFVLLNDQTTYKIEGELMKNIQQKW